MQTDQERNRGELAEFKQNAEKGERKLKERPKEAYLHCCCDEAWFRNDAETEEMSVWVCLCMYVCMYVCMYMNVRVCERKEGRKDSVIDLFIKMDSYILSIYKLSPLPSFVFQESKAARPNPSIHPSRKHCPSIYLSVYITDR